MKAVARNSDTTEATMKGVKGTAKSRRQREAERRERTRMWRVRHGIEDKDRRKEQTMDWHNQGMEAHFKE